jgi:hypothetical protein
LSALSPRTPSPPNSTSKSANQAEPGSNSVLVAKEFGWQLTNETSESFEPYRTEPSFRGLCFFQKAV